MKEPPKIKEARRANIVPPKANFKLTTFAESNTNTPRKLECEPLVNDPTLWQRVAKNHRQKPINCRRCESDFIPSLNSYNKQFTIKASCPNCGRYLKFLPLFYETKSAWPKKRDPHQSPPTETAESIALWEAVSTPRGPMPCSCGQAATPILQRVENGVLALCASCGKGIHLLRLQRAGDTDEQRRERLNMWSRIGLERGWKPTAAAHCYREYYGTFPPPELAGGIH